MIRAAERVSVTGLDAPAAEALVNLLTAVSLPDQGEVRIFGSSTASVADERAWFDMLDQLGLVTPRASLLGSLSVAQNLAMPFTLEIDPMAASVATRVAAVADEVGLATSVLSQRVGEVSARERLCVHLGRAVALDPRVLVLEHPTADLTSSEARAFGEILRGLAVRRSLAVLALTDDVGFATAVAEHRLALHPASGELRPLRHRWWS